MFFRLFDALWDGAKLLNPFIYIIFVLLLGREIPRAKGSSSLRENLDNFFRADGCSGLVCLDAIRGAEHIGRSVYCCWPRPEALVR